MKLKYILKYSLSQVCNEIVADSQHNKKKTEKSQSLLTMAVNES